MHPFARRVPVRPGATRRRSQASVSVRTGSLDTSVPDRDAHVVGPGFLDCGLYPLMTSRSGGMVRTGGERCRVSGELMTKGVERPVVIGPRACTAPVVSAGQGLRRARRDGGVAQGHPAVGFRGSGGGARRHPVFKGDHVRVGVNYGVGCPD
ncbi:YceI family protein, partial [Streptomyces wuyuanensis]|uniref:YceI family protein n=1 Tax=Streptomyces wuyuanensis TaxID=1196353 RepID=UPI0037FF8D0C